MKIALAQINPIIGEFNHNFSRIMHFVGEAVKLSCDLVVFSELSITGYPPRDLLERNDFIDANLACLERLMASVRGIGVICGFVDKNPAEEGNVLFNSSVLFENGKILHKVYKQLLPTYDIFDERRYFEPGSQSSVYAYKDHRIGLTICEDAWNDKDIFKHRIYSIDPVAQLVQAGADLVINVAASPFYLGHTEFRWNMFKTMACKYKVPFVYANQVGGNDSILFDGLSTAFDKNGIMAARARDFEEDFMVFDSKASEFSPDSLHPVSGSDIESILRALVMGTRDYVTKCGFSKVVVGLSGGIDSALTAAIAVKALGLENVSGVFMPSRYTSKENHEDTVKLSENLGIAYIQIPIDSMFKEFLRFISPDFKERNVGITEQNIQARIRGTILMALSNKYGSLVLSTGNKSELAVGYCTLYGDMTGGLAVISDVPKTTVYDLARFINQDKEYIPQRIIDKIPSAELKPDQSDQDDLPPYEVLDSILKGYIEGFKSANQLIQMGFDQSTVEDVISRVDRNEYKRHQAAPGLKVTSKAFGYGRRYPLAQRYTNT
ncbi:MAG: NAD+ synthase [Desulfobacterales bacterium]|uniref:Glutamine-dependent NAD(+) synthetase n=1 Tax=Candidatus Desulfatibia profunda TaxID=2841695 RepID=A0A8J6NXR4_9BACT|nr:NAD+ synthase [Candidatus Desulfatibia profunda]MBL7180168.1 NAD+ synthase [Desulfobacterales bacterium]